MGNATSPLQFIVHSAENSVIRCCCEENYDNLTINAADSKKCQELQGSSIPASAAHNQYLSRVEC